MVKLKRKTVIWAMLSSLIGLLVFLLLLAFVNFLKIYISNPVFLEIVNFLNANTWLIITMSLFFLIGEVFLALVFPFNLPAPLFNALGSIFLVRFVFKIFLLIDILIGAKIFSPFSWMAYFIYPGVFIIVLVVGYVLIFSFLGKRAEHREERHPKKRKRR